MRWELLAMLLLGAALFLPGKAPEAGQPRGGADDASSQAAETFRAYDIFVDSGDVPLAAYQVEFRARMGGMKIVGVEGGESAAFKAAPFYDPAAMQGERVIIGAMSTMARESLPSGRTRVARVHVMLAAGGAPVLSADVQTAGTAGGSKIDAGVSWAEAAPRNSGRDTPAGTPGND